MSLLRSIIDFFTRKHLANYERPKMLYATSPVDAIQKLQVMYPNAVAIDVFPFEMCGVLNLSDGDYLWGYRIKEAEEETA